MDSIVWFAALAKARGIHRNPSMAIYSDLANKLNPTKGPPPARFVFDGNATRTATELTLGRPKVFRETMKISRVNYPALWIEWEDLHRAKLREKFQQPEELAVIRPYPERFGFFIQAYPPDYRAGNISFAWTQKNPPGMEEFGKEAENIPNVSTVTTNFDLDDEFPIDFVEKYPLTLAELWIDNPVQHDAFHAIWKTATHRMNDKAAAPLICNEMSRALLFADVVGEYIMVWACQMVLNAARQHVDNTMIKAAAKQQAGGVELRSVDQSRLNKNRLRSGKMPLLDHRTVHIVAAPRAIETRGPLDFRRKSPRIHLVSSYLGWHGKIVFPYTRGSTPPR